MPKLEDVFAFSNESDFSQYQKWYTMWKRSKADPAVHISVDELKQIDVYWAAVKDAFEHILPNAASVLASYESAFKAETVKYEVAVKDLEKSNKLFEFYKSVLDRLTKLYLGSLSEMLTEVYREVYETTSKQVQLQMEDFRNKKVIRLNIINHVDGKDYVEDFGQEGGGAQIILGIIVSIYFLLTTGAPRIIFLDECLGCLFPETHHHFMKILQSFCQQLGFVFVIIDHHADRFRPYVSKVYVVDGGVYKEVLESELDDFFKSTAEVS